MSRTPHKARIPFDVVRDSGTEPAPNPLNKCWAKSDDGYRCTNFRGHAGPHSWQMEPPAQEAK